MLERRGVISGYEGSKPRQVLVAEADLPRVLAALAEPAAARSATSLLTRDARDRSNATRGTYARAHRRVRDRGPDQDPGQVPARAGERRVGPVARARRSSRASCAPTPRRSDWTARRSWRSTACTTSARARRRSSRSSRRRSSAPRALCGCRERGPRAAICRGRCRRARDRAVDRRPGLGRGRRLLERRTPNTTAPRVPAQHSASHRTTTHGRDPRTSHHGPTLVALSLRPTAAVYVCLIGDNGRKLIPGTELQPGDEHPHVPRQTLRDSRSATLR